MPKVRSFPNSGRRSANNPFVIIKDPCYFYNKWTGEQRQKLTPKVRNLIYIKAKERGWDEVKFSDGICYLEKKFS